MFPVAVIGQCPGLDSIPGMRLIVNIGVSCVWSGNPRLTAVCLSWGEEPGRKGKFGPEGLLDRPASKTTSPGRFFFKAFAQTVHRAGRVQGPGERQVGSQVVMPQPSGWDPAQSLSWTELTSNRQSQTTSVLQRNAGLRFSCRRGPQPHWG